MDSLQAIRDVLAVSVLSILLLWMVGGSVWAAASLIVWIRDRLARR